jgi:hypothetical protein
MRQKERIKVRVHEAFFVGVNRLEKDRHVFVNITNTCKHRQLTITHLYLEYTKDEEDKVLDIIPSGFKLPWVLEASVCAEIAIPCDSLPFNVNFNGFKVRTSDGEWYQSKKQHTLASNAELLILK